LDTGFLDSNVLANWMLLDAQIRLGPVSASKLLNRLVKQKPSYLLLERVRKDNKLKGILSTSGFAFAEVISVLFEQYIQTRMYNQGIPLKYWERERRRERLSLADRTDMAQQIRHLQKEFFDIEDMRIAYVDDDYRFDDVVRLITYHRIDQYDAILLSTAVGSGCDYFITEDMRLRESLPKFERNRHEAVGMISPQRYLGLIDKKQK